MKKLFRFRIRTLAIFVALVAFLLAAWEWTSTTGVSQLKDRYFDDLRRNIASDVGSDEIGMSVEECVDEIDTSEYFQNPRSPCPFVICVDTNYLYRSGTGLQADAGNTQVHVWFFGYVSNAL